MFHHTSIAPDPGPAAFCSADVFPAAMARQGDARALAQALRESRRDTLATLAAFDAALDDLRVPERSELNPPLWELGHIGWFQAHWTTRNPQMALGWRANPADLPAHPDDALYDSSAVAHSQRWTLPMPTLEATREQLAQQLQEAILQLNTLDGSAQSLYFHRLALLHEDMHHEAALYMARVLGVPISDARWKEAPVLPSPGAPLPVPASRVTQGGDMSSGFRFDNECGEQTDSVDAFEIDAQVLRWRDYLPFVLDGGPMPRYLRRVGTRQEGWQSWQGGVWMPLDINTPACHINAVQARAWCEWAGRRLPTEAEWVAARQQHPTRFCWGQVWEWTATAFAPFAGFEPHPYRDYSAPWFDGRPVLRGASFLTQPRMRHPDYRNFFAATRDDVPAGFRTCAL